MLFRSNFQEPNQPRAMALPTGRGAAFKSDMANLIEVLRHAIPSAFESEDYRSRRHALEEEFRSRHEAGLEAVQKEAQENQIAVLRTPMGLALAPVRNDEVVSPEDFQKLPAAEQTNIREKMNRLQEKLEVVLSNAPRWEREARTRLKELNRGVTNLAVGHLIDDLRGAYADIPVVQGYLDAARQDLIENVEEFLNPEAPRPEEAAAKAMAGAAGGLPTAFRRYQVNLMISHHAESGAPVVYEDNPNLQSLLGRIEHIAQFGALMTDFSLIQPGALHRANGGYLVLDARKVLLAPFAWEALKRSLNSRSIKIESLDQILSVSATVVTDLYLRLVFAGTWIAGCLGVWVVTKGFESAVRTDTLPPLAP